MKSFFSMFGKSAKELTNPVNLVKVGMLIAISMVLEMFSIDLTFVKINFAFLAIAVIGMLFGPTVGFVAGLACDIVGFIAHPSGAFIPVYTLVAGLQGLIYGIVLYSKQDGQWVASDDAGERKSVKGLDVTLFIRAVIARLLDVVIINLVINTSLNLHFGYIHADSYSAAIVARVAKNVIELAADIPLLFALLPAALVAHRKTGGLKKKSAA
ncbi:MAG: folate family ECF transporter S component [Ruminococcus sp.]|nr:folate family ECF transporter S component [Ruminococcus sp.]